MDTRVETTDDRLENIENQLINIQAILNKLDTNIQLLNNKLDTKEIQDDKILEECKKMGSHIDFIENVYDNVKHPLGFICNKIKYMTGNNNNTYRLTDTSVSNNKL